MKDFAPRLIEDDFNARTAIHLKNSAEALSNAAAALAVSLHGDPRYVLQKPCRAAPPLRLRRR